jgi:hypothetical protein
MSQRKTIPINISSSAPREESYPYRCQPPGLHRHHSPSSSSTYTEYRAAAPPMQYYGNMTVQYNSIHVTQYSASATHFTPPEESMDNEQDDEDRFETISMDLTLEDSPNVRRRIDSVSVDSDPEEPPSVRRRIDTSSTSTQLVSLH